MRLKLILFLFSTIFKIVNCIDNETIDYYVELITQQTLRAFSYPLPLDASEHKPSSDDHKDYGTFDYIIVGAGSAGAVIANRLSDITTTKVLLLEAGGFESNFSDIPRLSPYLQGLEYNWNHNTTPQESACQGMVNQKCAYPRGKGLGGTSIINGIMYVRGNRLDYDNWAEQGNPGWSYEEILPLFKKSENAQIKEYDEGYHGKGGYLSIEHPKPNTPQFEAFVEANVELGRKVIDYNGEEQLGVSRTQFSTIKGQRDSTGKAFLYPTRTRDNLEILTNAYATKIILKSSLITSLRATGVKFTKDGVWYDAKAEKEVILSAGVFGSPQLLMLSGIGPKKHLKELKISVEKDLPVGHNLHDHQTYYALNFRTNYSAPVSSLEELIEDYLNGEGPFTIGGNAEGLGFYQSPLEKTPGYPDLELIILPSNNTGDFVQNVMHYDEETYKNMYGDIDPQNSFTLIVILLHPKSRGTLRLKTNNPFDYPEINPEFLSDAEGEDIERMYQGIQIALELLETEAFKNLNVELINASMAACKDLEYLSKDYWYCQLKQLTAHSHHPVGTCKMGPRPSRGAVVDHELKVHGVEQLRVADASIIPEITSGHTNAAAIMIGEKVSELILTGN